MKLKKKKDKKLGKLLTMQNNKEKIKLLLQVLTGRFTKTSDGNLLCTLTLVVFQTQRQNILQAR